jgi:hypothetical protein
VSWLSLDNDLFWARSSWVVDLCLIAFTPQQVLLLDHSLQLHDHSFRLKVVIRGRGRVTVRARILDLVNWCSRVLSSRLDLQAKHKAITLRLRSLKLLFQRGVLIK